ncbi:uncharacterized protein ARMOST_18069 [Armillaria ostoyae]|uniref:Uncharacterized protein n=1 Tax=Armillaria ostoyae TaxID=47428 RepID=A0A284S0Z0_ARMOS|nr:uncharacterized protein ARMOST_18069 [Armillaria ostoyae]
MSKHPFQKVRDTSRGGFDHDKKHYRSLYRRERAPIEDFQAWLLNEQHVHGIRFFVLSSSENVAPLKKRRWLVKHTFYCSRHKPCTPRYVGPPKHIKGNCFCSITVKTYPNIPIVRANYNDDHSHPLGAANSTLSEKVLSFVREKIGPSAIKPDASAQTVDDDSEPAKYCDLSVDAWRPASALYLDNPDPFAPMSMIDLGAIEAKTSDWSEVSSSMS